MESGRPPPQKDQHELKAERLQRAHPWRLREQGHWVTFAAGSEDRNSPGQRPALLAPLLSWLRLPDKLPQAGNLKQH